MTCKDFQKDLALAAVGGLEGPRLASLRDHVRACAECSARLRSYESICSAQAAAASELNALPVRFKGVHTPKAHGAPSCPQILRWGLPVAGVGFALALFLVTQNPVPRIPTSEEHPTASVATSDGLPAGSLARYRNALGQTGKNSLESILTRDADVFLRTPSPMELEQLRNEVFLGSRFVRSPYPPIQLIDLGGGTNSGSPM